MPFRTVVVRLVALCGLVLAGTGQAAAQEQESDLLRVFMNHARVLKLDRPVSKVIVGNSNVADATVADSTTIVLTGRSFGTTNLVLLDAEGNAIADERILVSIDEGNTVRVFRQTNRSILSCTPNCEQHAEFQNNASP
ncbi:pilus assembly protein N-terminal domain-containing protein [Neorhizobium sp. CSC1952]|uniref:pilus assembly protein N-terminal domain-containing protein n=1 Tax=Neorhizobium TaxID=1525371 RepID=UPI0025A52F1E|nr:pilus assembly protein N-terminal domain-containing protein [Rhizobium sp. CSC1952]WJR68480.1 pilus assembly protein N-terminal domain-containing protein [Rhizobium sp. CSC1952]